MSLVEKALWQIETTLTQPLTLRKIADGCAVSRFHLSRVFRSATGMSVMGYVRGRRLTEAARALSIGNTEILTIALNAQFGSHEAFTRAFSDYFGVLPSTVRKRQSLESLITMEPLIMDNSLLIEIDAPRFTKRNAFRVVGVSKRYTFEENGGIPAQWQSFNQRVHEVPLPVGSTTYGICYDADAQGRFSYLAGLETTGRTETPAGMDSVDVHAGRYAVFTHVGHISDIRKTTYTIWNKALTEEEVEVRKAPDFEVYDERFDPETGMGTVEIWIPIV